MQHLESIVIHWTRQIKDVVNNHDNALSAEILGPLEEIEVGGLDISIHPIHSLSIHEDSSCVFCAGVGCMLHVPQD